jgi:hypothetical protein
MMINMKTRGIVLVALLAGIAALNCGCSNRLAPTGSKAVIMPLAVGNRWIGTTHPLRGDDLFDTLRIIRDTVVGNERWYVTSNGVMLANHPDGLYTWEIWAARRDQGKPTRALKFPVAVGDALNDLGNFRRVYEHGDSGDVESIREVLTVVSTDTLVDVPAGRYHCIKAVLKRYRADGSPDPVQFSNDGPLYFAPGIGLLKTEGSYRPNLGSASMSNPWQLYDVSLH